jgi:hypothetical protein
MRKLIATLRANATAAPTTEQLTESSSSATGTTRSAALLALRTDARDTTRKNSIMKQVRVTKPRVQPTTDVRECAWAETDIFPSIRDVAPKGDDYCRLLFEWGI